MIVYAQKAKNELFVIQSFIQLFIVLNVVHAKSVADV